MAQDKRRQKVIIYIVGFLFLCNYLAWFVVWEISRPILFEVVFFDVGQGDSALIKTPQGHQILIDGGPDARVLEKLGQEMPFWDKTLDLVILSHPEQDHMAGLLAVLENYKVSYILWTGVERDTALFKEWQKALVKEQAQDGAVVKLASAGQKIIISPKSQIEILYPFENMAGRIMKDSNSSSIVCRLVHNKTSFLFTGDIGQSGEKALLSREDIFLSARVLKVAHHGSKYSTSEDFLAAVSPAYAVISAGRDNSYGHPHPDVLARLAKFAITVLRTDHGGDIRFKLKNNEYAQ